MPYDPWFLAESFASPELIGKMAGVGAYPERQALLMEQMRRAQALASTPGAQGLHAGGTFVAASPLEHLGVALNRTLGQIQQGSITGAQRKLIEADQATREGIARIMAEAMRKYRQQQMPQQQQEPAQYEPSPYSGVGYYPGAA